MKQTVDLNRRQVLRFGSRRAIVGILCGLCLLLTGCAESKSEFLKRLPEVFTEKEGKVSVALQGPEGLIAALGKPDERKSIGGTTQEWLYRFSDGAIELRISFSNPETQLGQDLPPTRAALVRMNIYDENGRPKAAG